MALYQGDIRCCKKMGVKQIILVFYINIQYYMAMEFNVIASGSSGNCYFIDSNGHYIFVDAGATLISIKKALGSKALDNSRQVSLFVTHEHTDHISGILPLISCYNPKIYTSKGTSNALLKKGVSPENIFTIDANIAYDFTDFAVMPFNTIHDAVQPFGFKFDFGSNILSIATDFGVITDEIYKAIEDSNVLMVESNYEEELLKKNKKYPEYLKRRILSKEGHLSNKDAFYLLGELSKRKLKRCFLGHVSENNNDYNILEKYADAADNMFDVQASVLKQRKSKLFNI